MEHLVCEVVDDGSVRHRANIVGISAKDQMRASPSTDSRIDVSGIKQFQERQAVFPPCLVIRGDIVQVPKVL